MKIKRLLAILLSLCMTITILSAIASAEPDSETESNDVAASDNADDASNNTQETNEVGDVVITEEGITGDGTTGNIADLESFALASENDNLAFYINDITGFFAILNKKTNAIWYSNPLDWEKDQVAKATNLDQLRSQLVVTYLNSHYDTITIPSTEAHIVAEHNDKQQVLTYVFSGATRNFTIPVVYELKEDYLDVSLKIEDIEENSDARITQITFLPFLGAGGLKDNGYAFIPDGSGSLMTFNKDCKNLNQYTGYIYNRDLTSSSSTTSYIDLNETISLPVYGIMKNGAAYLSVITEGAGTAAIKCRVSKLINSYNNICTHVVVRDTQTRRNATGSTGQGMYYSDETCSNLSLRIYPLAADKSDYVGMAECYRNYLIKESNLKKIDSSSNIANSLNIDFFCAVKSPTHFLGIPYTGVKELTSYQDVMDIIAELKEKGITNPTITLSGWSAGGLESAITTDITAESKLGGKKKLKELIEYAKAEGTTLVFDNDIQSYYASSSKVKKFKHTAFSLASTPVTIYPFSKSLNRSITTGKFHHLIHPKFMVDFANQFVDKALSFGINNISFKSAGTDPYAAYNNNNIITRDKSVEMMKELFASAAEKTDGIISTRVGNSFVLGSVDNIIEAPVYSSELIMAQTTVPFYEIVLRGYVNMSAEAMNLSSEVSELELKSAETGLSLFYKLMDSESTELQDTSFADYYACSYDDYDEIIIETYNRMKPVYDAVGTSEITGHVIYSDTVRITTFENGAKVYVNYGETDATVDGITVAARSYKAVGGGK